MSNESVTGVPEVRVPEGLKHLVKGYSDYMSEVVLGRAIPLIDGLKPSQRRILYTLYKSKSGSNLTKCANVVGETMKLHPHGDGAIYDTLVHLVDVAEYQNIPFIEGKGSFGKVYFTESAAASRYTECKLSTYSKLLFGEMSGVDFVPSYDNKFQEPSLLPVAFPSIFCNATQGIAVGLASNIPSFNMLEVNQAVIDLIEKGSLNYVLAPDFRVGGEYIQNDAELQRIMDTGRGKIKLRGQWHIEGKQLVIDCIPYYTNIDAIDKVAKELQGVSDTRDESGFNGFRYVVECKSKARVEEVLYQLLRDSDLQMTVTTNISVVVKDKPKTCGVTEILRDWIDFRKGVLTKKFTLDLKAVVADITRYEFLVDLLNNKEVLDEYINQIKTSALAGKAFLKKFRPVSDDIIDWVMGLSFRSISNVKQKQDHLNGLYESKKSIESDLANIEGVICSQLREINNQYSGSCKRKTLITTKDYTFAKDEVQEDIYPVTVFINDNFIKKVKSAYVPTAVMAKGLQCLSNESIFVCDTEGRILRVDMKDLPDGNIGDRGTYIPRMFNLPEGSNVIFADKEQDSEVTFLYSDGFASVFHLGEWMNMRRKARIVQNGISPYAKYIIGLLDQQEEYPYVAIWTTGGKFGFIDTNFKHKSRTARTRVIDMGNDSIKYFIPCTENELFKLVADPDKFMGVAKKVKIEDEFNADYFNEKLRRLSENG